jgi:DNA-binding response OmpR family regulator
MKSESNLCKRFVTTKEDRNALIHLVEQRSLYEYSHNSVMSNDTPAFRKREKILLADDVTAVVLRLQAVLQRRNLSVWFAYKIEEIFSQIASFGPFDLIVLGSTVDDVPAQSVLDSLKRTNRVENSSVLIIDSSLNSQNDKTWREIEKARQLADQIDRMLGRTSVPEPSPLRCGPLIINTENHEVRIHDTFLNLTETEMRVLYYFARHVGELVSRDDLLSAVWGNKTVKDQILNAYLKRLRAICRAETQDLSFRTVAKMGYQLLLRTPRSKKQ